MISTRVSSDWLPIIFKISVIASISVRDQESLLSVLALHKEGKLLTRQNAKFSDKYLGSMDREAALNQVSSFVFAEAVKKEIA